MSFRRCAGAKRERAELDRNEREALRTPVTRQIAGFLLWETKAFGDGFAELFSILGLGVWQRWRLLDSRRVRYKDQAGLGQVAVAVGDLPPFLL